MRSISLLTHFSLIAMLAAHPVVAETPESLLTTPLASLLGAAPTISDPKLSPDGKHIVFLQQNGLGVTFLRVLNLEEQTVGSVLSGSETGYELRWCAFANATRVLCDLRTDVTRPCNSRQSCGDHLLYAAINVDGSDFLQIPTGTGCLDIEPWRHTHRIDWLPEDSDHILFTCGRETVRVDVYDGTREHIDGEINAAVLRTDGHGFANMYRWRDEYTDRWFVRDSSDSRWVQFLETNAFDLEEPFRPVGHGPDTGSVFHIAWNAATDTWSLFERQLAGEFDDRLVFAHPAVDIESVNTLGPYQRVISVAYSDGRLRRHIIDERIAEVHEYIAGLLPGINVEVLDESWDGRVYLARAKLPRRTGDFILVDMVTESMVSIGPEYLHLADYELADTHLVEFAGNDGGRISGLLTLPKDVPGPVPAVIIPRDDNTYDALEDLDYLAEFLAASGYAVLRVNTRGPEDLGGGWLASRSVAGWRRGVDDLRAASAFLVESGISNPGKLCAAGTRYGAHPVFMSAIESPELFSCLISMGGMADPAASRASATIRVPSGNGGTRSVSPIARELRDANPIRRANEIEAPVLMFQGGRDNRMEPIEHALPLARALEKADKDVALIEYEYASHLIRRPLYRTDMLVRISNFLAAHIGPNSD